MECFDNKFRLKLLKLADGLRFPFFETNTFKLIIKGYLPRKLHINEHS